MKRSLKVFVLLYLISILSISSFPVSASEVGTMYYPVTAELSTSKTSFNINEVVEWSVKISGGHEEPNFDVHFMDTEGNSYWIYDLEQYNTSFNLDYQNAGDVTAYITVYGPGEPGTDNATVSIKNIK
jgi:hypothetical protein